MTPCASRSNYRLLSGRFRRNQFSSCRVNLGFKAAKVCARRQMHDESRMNARCRYGEARAVVREVDFVFYRLACHARP